MTNRNPAKRHFAPGTSQIPRSLHTFVAQMARMEDAERHSMAARIRGLRGHRPQPKAAEAAGVSLRAYQAWELAESTPNWNHLEALAQWGGVAPEFLLYGEREDGADESQLDRLEQMLNEVRDLVLRLVEPGRAGEVAESPPAPADDLGLSPPAPSPSDETPDRRESRKAARRRSA